MYITKITFRLKCTLYQIFTLIICWSFYNRICWSFYNRSTHLSVWTLTWHSKCSFNPLFSRTFFRWSNVILSLFSLQDHNDINFRSFGGCCWNWYSKSFHSDSKSPSSIAISWHFSGEICDANLLTCCGNGLCSLSNLPSP